MITPSGSLILSDGTAVIVDLDRLDYVAQWRWKNVNGRYPGRNVEVGGQHGTIYLERLISGATGKQIVHVRNNNRYDLREENLEVLPSRAEHMRMHQLGSHRDPARGPGRTSQTGYKGVSAHITTGRWQAIITLPAAPGRPARQRHLGSYHTAEEAARAYDRAAREIHGPRAYQNLPADE